jgi:hypothetical protein
MEPQSQSPVQPSSSPQTSSPLSSSIPDVLRSFSTAGLPKSSVTPPLSSTPPSSSAVGPIPPVNAQAPVIPPQQPTPKKNISIFVLLGIFAFIGVVITASLLWYQSYQRSLVSVPMVVSPTVAPSPTAEPSITATGEAMMTGDPAIDQADVDITHELETVNKDLQTSN